MARSEPEQEVPPVPADLQAAARPRTVGPMPDPLPAAPTRLPYHHVEAPAPVPLTVSPNAAKSPEGSKWQGRALSELVCIELCSGCARLSRTLKLAGFDALAFDSLRNEHTSVVHATVLDLSTPDAERLVMDLLQADTVHYAHMTPPCCTHFACP